MIRGERWSDGCLLIVAVATAGPVYAQPEKADKSQYTLFNPTPAELMRPLSPDRPDATESPITVDAGHAQAELSFFDYTHNHDAGVETDTWTFLDANLKVGLDNDTDVQFVFSAYTQESADVTDGPGTTLNGFGDVQVRLKRNLWGNDPPAPALAPGNGAGGWREGTAFGVMPFIQIPSGTQVSSGHVEGGFIATFAVDLAERWSLGAQVEIDAVYDDVDGDYDAEFLHTTVLGYDTGGPVGAFIEYLGVLSTDGGTGYQAYANAGLTYEINPNLMLDVATQFGLTEDADDFRVFVGMTIRR